MKSSTFFFIFIPILSLLLLFINLVLAPHNPYQEKDSAFECGFNSFLNQNRTQFSISFFIFALLFLIFDIEVTVMFPYCVSSYHNDIYGLSIFMLFLCLLTAGFVFELGKKALNIESKQTLLSSDKDPLIKDSFINLKSGGMLSHIVKCLAKFLSYLKYVLLNTKIIKGLKKFFNNIVFRRALVIFVVGLVSRIFINYVCDINVFKEYTDIVSLTYFGFMAGFSSLIIDLPKISFNVFNIFKIRDVIRNVSGNNSFMDNKMTCGDFSEKGETGSKPVTTYSMNSSNNQGGNQQGNIAQGGNQQGNIAQGGNQQGMTPALIQGSPDIKLNGKYNTPPNMQYIPGGNNQPNARILAKAMEDSAIRNHFTDRNDNASTVAFDCNAFEDDTKRFFADFMRHKYPNRSPNAYWNSAPVRKALNNLQ